MKARYAGWNPDGRRIEVGDDIVKRGGKWVLKDNPDVDPDPGRPRGWWGDGEYPTADVVYDARGGATSDYEWYGDDPDYNMPGW